MVHFGIQRSTAIVFVTILIAAYLPIPAAAATGTVTIKIFDSAGSTQLYSWSTSIDVLSSYPRFSVGSGGRGVSGSQTGEVAVDDLAVTKQDGTTTTMTFASAPTVRESSTGTSTTVFRHDFSQNGQMLALGDSAWSCSGNYQSVEIDGTAQKIRFKFRRVTGDGPGDGAFWDMSIGLMPSDDEAVTSTCGRPDNMIGIYVAGDGDAVRNSVRGYADGSQDGSSITPVIGTWYTAEVALPATSTPQNDCGTGGDAGNTAQTATPRSVPVSSCQGAFPAGSGDTNDFYRFTANAGQRITATVTPPSNMDFDICITDASGSTLGSCGTGGVGAVDTAVYDVTSSMEARVRVYAYGSSTGQYTLSISLTSNCAGSPTASLTPSSQSGVAPYSASFSLGASPSSGCTLSSWTLSFGDGTPSDSGSGAPPASRTHQYTTVGSYTATLTVVQSNNAQSSATGSVSVSSGGGGGATVFFEDTFDSGSSLSTSKWNNIDWPVTLGSSCNGGSPTPPQGSQAVYKADTGYANPDRKLDTVQISIPSNAGSAATLSFWYGVCNDDTGELSIDATYSDGRSGYLDFPRHVGSVTQNSESITVNPGGWVKFRFLSNSGLILDHVKLSGTTTATCSGSPSASLTPSSQSGAVSYTATFGLGATPSAGCSISSWSLSYGDGSASDSGSGAPPASKTHTYTGTGTYTATLTVTQSNGNQASASGSVTVTPPAPPNDHLANALWIDSYPYADGRSTTNAGTQNGEPLSPACTSAPVGKTIWYALYSPVTRNVRLDTSHASTSFDTVLVVYRGSGFSTFTQVACDDDGANSAGRSSLTFQAQGGTSYYIQVGGYNGQSGTAVLQAATTPNAPSTPTVSAPAPGQLRIDWSAPASNGPAITAYKIYASADGWSYSLVHTADASARQWTEQGLSVGPRYYKLTAVNAVGEGLVSGVGSGTAYAHYRVELVAWIPHRAVVDPRPHQMDPPYSWTYQQYAGGNCNTHPDNNGQVTPYFGGDNHIGLDGTFRVRAILEFDWNGAQLSNVDDRDGESHYGPTKLMRDYVFNDGHTQTCMQATQTIDHSTNAYQISGTDNRFRLDYASPNPMIAGSPDIDGWLEGTIGPDGEVTFDYQLDQFPSQGFLINKNGARQLTAQASMVSCLSDDEVMGPDGAATLFNALTPHYPGGPPNQDQAQYVMPSTAQNALMVGLSEVCYDTDAQGAQPMPSVLDDLQVRAPERPDE